MRSQPDLDSGNLSLFQPAMDSWLKAAREQAAKIGPLTKLVCGTMKWPGLPEHAGENLFL